MDLVHSHLYSHTAYTLHIFQSIKVNPTGQSEGRRLLKYLHLNFQNRILKYSGKEQKSFQVDPSKKKLPIN